MRVTLKEIADAAELSVSTASRALNGHPAISTATRDKVRRLADQLRYRRVRSHRRPDSTQELAGRNVAIVSLGMDRSLLALPVVADSLAGVEAALSAAGASVQLAHVPDPGRTPAGLRLKTLDGAVLAGPMQGRHVAAADSDLVRRLRKLPTVWVLGRPSGCWGDAAASNDYQTGAMAAEYLVARGHRRLAFVNPKPDHLLFMRREDGFTATARRLGAAVECFCEAPPGGWQLPLEPPLHVQTVQALVDRLLAARPRPTAAFAAADSVATLVYRALAVRGLRAGSDLSVISANNDHSLIAGLHPNLTTFDVHAFEIGRFAVRQLAARIADPEPAPCTEVMIESTAVEGQSVADIQPQ
jgi:LacI family transcriptional regulator